MVGIAGRTAIIVEDEAIVAMDLETRLTRLGLHVLGVAADGGDAIDLILQNKPDLVLLDVQLASSTSGLDVARAVAGAFPAVLFLTSFSDDQTVAKATATRPYGFLIKPFDERALFAAISVALERRDSEAQLRTLSDVINRVDVGVFLCDVMDDELIVPVLANPAFASWAEGDAIRGVILDTCRDILTSRERTRTVVSTSGRRTLSIHAEIVEQHRVVVFATDITRLHEAEVQLEASQRQEVVSRFVQGLAHDFNNELTIIMASTELMMERLTTRDLDDDLLLVRQAASRASALTHQLLDLSRAAEGDTIELGAVVEQLTPLLARAARPATFTVNGSGRGWRCSMSATSLAQLLMNLVMNARDATAEMVGLVSLTVESRDGRARLIVEDNGRGMSDDVMAHAFDAGFSTKGTGGNGLGLMMVRVIAERAGGTVQLASGRTGTCITVEFPVRSAVEFEARSVAGPRA